MGFRFGRFGEISGWFCAINANTISVTFTGEDAPAEAVEVTLEEALVHGQTEVTFVYEGKTYTAELNEAYVDALTAATEAVVVAEGSLLEADLAEAEELVDALEASDAKTLLNARLDSVGLKIQNIITAVNNAVSAGNQVALFKLLEKAPFVDADADRVADYIGALTGSEATIADIQAVIDAENLAPETAATITLVDNAVTAVGLAVATPDGDNGATPPVSLIDLAQEAIDALPETISDDVIAGAATTVTATVKADLQAELDEVKVVAPVLKATNQIKLLEALQNPAFERVNSDFIATYENDLTGSEITIAAIQGVIDAANLTETQAAVVDAETSLAPADVAKAQALVNKLPEDVAPATAKADEQAKLDYVNALITLKNAKTEAQVLAALKAEALALTDINDAVSAEYKTEFDTIVATLALATDLQTNLVDEANGKAEAAAVLAITTNFPNYDEADATDQAKALKELNRLADVSDLDKATIDAELIEQYIIAIEADLTGGSSTIDGSDDPAAIQLLINGENAVKEETLRLAAVNAATTSAEMRTALTAVAVAENTTAYINLSSQAKLEVAELVLVARNAITGASAKKFANTGAVTTAIGGAGSGAIKDRADLLAAVNLATDISGMQTALNVAALPEFQALGALEKVNAAEAVLDALTALKAETPANSFKTIEAIKIAAGL